MTELDHSQVNNCLDLSALDNHVILMTGGTGFVGQALLEAFIKSSTRAKIYVATRNVQSIFYNGDTRIHMLARDRLAIPHGLTDIIHLEPEQSMMTVSCAIYAIASTFHANTLFASSGAAQVLGTEYANNKRAGEAIAKMYGAKIARLWTFVGPHLPIGYAVTDFIRDGLAGGPIIVQGDGKAVRSYMYTTDLAEWMWTLLMHGRSGQIYNVGSDDAITIGDLAIEIASKFGCRVVVVNDPDIPSAHYVPDITRTRQELGLSIKVGRSEAIDKTIAWHRERRGDGSAINSLSDQIK